MKSERVLIEEINQNLKELNESYNKFQDDYLKFIRKMNIIYSELKKYDKNREV
jgi:hypothetical protein